MRLVISAAPIVYWYHIAAHGAAAYTEPLQQGGRIENRLWAAGLLLCGPEGKQGKTG